jgi:beta-galactosidase
LNGLKKLQPNKPLYVAEFWSGWFDKWGDKSHNRGFSVENFGKVLEQIVFQMNSSVNIYMFIGGTNFGFMNGGGFITSYDYDAPLSESGSYL